MSCAADKDKGMNILLRLTLNNIHQLYKRERTAIGLQSWNCRQYFYPPEKLDPAASTALHVSSSSGAGAVRILPSMTIKSLFMGSGQQR